MIGLAFWFLTGTLFGIGSDRWDSGRFGFITGWEILAGPFEIAGTYNADVYDIDSIDIDWVSGDVTVRPHDGDQIRVTEYAQRELRGTEKFHVSTSGDTLTIRFCEPGHIGRMPKKRLEVLIPRRLSESIDRLSVETVSGGIDVDSMVTQTLKADTVSGLVNISEITSRTLGVNSTSGAITVTSVLAIDFEAGSTSGAIQVFDSSARSIKCNNTSGSINISGAYGDVSAESLTGRIALDNSERRSISEANTSSGSLYLSGSFERVEVGSLSGSISVRSMIVPSTLKADNSSGSITVIVPNEGEITVFHSSVSGRFSSEVPVTMQDRGARFEFTTISGSTSIQEYME